MISSTPPLDEYDHGHVSRKRLKVSDRTTDFASSIRRYYINLPFFFFFSFLLIKLEAFFPSFYVKIK